MGKINCPKCGEKINKNWYYHKNCGWNAKDTQVSKEETVVAEPQEEIAVSESRPPGIHISKDSIKDGFRKFIGFFSSKHIWIILLLIPLLLAGYVRVQSGMLPATDVWATESVVGQVRSQIGIEIDSKYPNLLPADRDQLIQQQLIELDQAELQTQINQVSAYFKDRLTHPDGTVYLHAIDPYQHYRRASNLVDHGNLGDEYEGGSVNGIKVGGEKDGADWDSLRSAPLGKPAFGNNVHVRGGAYAYMFLNLFTDISLMKVFFFIPAVLAALSIIPIFFIARRFGGNIAGFFAGIGIAVQPTFLIRTIAGFSDTDVYPILFGLFIAWFFLESLESNTLKKRLIWGSLAGALVGLFSYAWTGWWYIFYFAIGTLGLYGAIKVAVAIWKKQNWLDEIKSIATIFGLLIGVSMLVSFITNGQFYTWFEFLTGPAEFLHLKDVATQTLFPNINVTIAEMASISFKSLVSRYGVYLFWIGLAGIPLTLLKKVDGKRDYKYAIFFSIWAGATIFASLRGQRFAMMLVPAWGVGFGMCIGMVINWIGDIGTKINYLKKSITITILTIVGVAVLFPSISTAMAMGEQSVPSMNDAWYDSLSKIDKEAHPDAIINSWWDFGHWFAAIGNRRVTFDGAHQVPYGAFWVGHALYTPYEKLAVGILRMLDCGADTAEKKLNTYLGYEMDGNPETIAILLRILPIKHTEKERAKTKLMELAPSLSDTQAEDVLQYTHCVPPENYFITSKDMIPKASVWGHFGKWDFQKAMIYGLVGGKSLSEKTKILKEEFNYSEKDASRVAQEILSLENDEGVDFPGDRWISPYPGYVSTSAPCSRINKTTLVCENGPVINTELWDINLYEGTTPFKPKLFTFFHEGLFYTKTSNFENTADVEVILVKKGDEYRTSMSVGGLAPSMFSRLHLYGGEGLTHFKLFNYAQSIAQEEIFVWRVDWTGDGFYGKGSEANTNEINKTSS